MELAVLPSTFTRKWSRKWSRTQAPKLRFWHLFEFGPERDVFLRGILGSAGKLFSGVLVVYSSCADMIPLTSVGTNENQEHVRDGKHPIGVPWKPQISSGS